MRTSTFICTLVIVAGLFARNANADEGSEAPRKTPFDFHESDPVPDDVPYGWHRDDQGRLMQVTFDLHRRAYLGASYSPQWGARQTTGRSSFDFALLVYEKQVGRHEVWRHRLRLVEGEVFLAPFSGDLVLFHYDFSMRDDDPTLRLTTFFGKPQRHDLYLDLGLWVEAGHLEVLPTAGDHFSLWRLATVQGALDLWQSKDLYSFVRVRGGIGGERTETDDYRFTPAAALEASFLVGDSGFHHVGGEASYAVPFDPWADELFHRTRAQLQYELIALAINDQPVTLRIALGAERRDDIPGFDDRWTTRLDAGLRFNLWAPPL